MLLACFGAGTSDEAAAAALQQQQYGDERCGYGSRDDPLALPSPAEVEAALLQLPPGADKGAASKQQLQAWHERFKGVAEAAAGLEQLASAATTQYMDAQGAAYNKEPVHCCVRLAPPAASPP